MSLQELLKLYAGLSTASFSADPSPSNQPSPAQGDVSLQSGRPPDASYFSSQAEAVLASIQQLRLLYQQQQEEEDRALSLETAGESGGPLVESGGGASSAFAARADKLSATVGALATAFAAAAAAASEPAGTPSRSGAFPSASASGGTSRPGAGAGGGIGGAPWPYFPPMQQYQQQMPTEPLVSLFTSFMAQVASSREVSLAGGMTDGPGGGGGEGGNTKKRKNRKKKKKTKQGGDDVLQGGDNGLRGEAEHPPPRGAASPGSGLASRPGHETGEAEEEEASDVSSASASLAIPTGSSKLRGRKAKGQAKARRSDGAGHQLSLEATHQLGDEATVAARPPVEGVDSQASDTADGAVNGSANGSAGDGAGEGGDSGGSSSSGDEGNSSSGDDGGDGSDGEGDDEAAAAPSASELALMFGRFLRGPGGLAGLPPAELQAIMMAAQQAGDGAGPGAAGGLPVEAVRMQVDLEARHAELLASSPEAAALWEDAKLMAGVAAQGGLQYRSRPGSAPVGGKDGLSGGSVLLGGGEAGGIDSPLRPPGAMLGDGAEGTEWQSPLVGRSMHSAVEPDDDHSGEGVSARGRGRWRPICEGWGRAFGTGR